MLPGTIAPGIPEWRTEVTVNGIERIVQSVSWDAEMSGDLPEQVIAAAGLADTSGTISWATQDPVDDRPVSPWGKIAGWPPSAGDKVRVRVTDGTTWWTRFTGVIDNTTGNPTSGYQSKIIDHKDRISGTFTHQALLRHMTPFVEDADYRSVGLNYWYVLTQALRSTGLCNVPPIEAPSAMSATMQGSAWPEAGDISAVNGFGGNLQPSFFYTDFGYAAGGFYARYRPRLAEPSTAPVQVTMVVAPTHSAVAYTEVFYGQSGVRFRASADRGLVAYYTPTGGSWTAVASLSAAASGDYRTAQLLVKNGTWTIRTDAGGSASGSQALAAGTMSVVDVTANSDARIAGVQVSHPTGTVREFASIGFTPSMRFTPSGLASTMDMSPALKGRSVKDLMQEILKATLTAAWWDEEGVLVLRPSDLLRGTAPSQTITTADDITSLAWEDSLLAVRSAVEVAWKDPAISKGRQYRLELWRGPEESVVNGDDPVQQFVSPESGMEWFGVDRTINKLDDTNWGAFNSRRGSYAGLRYEYQSGNDAGKEAPTTTSSVGVTSESFYSDSLMITTTVYGIPANVEGVSATSNEATALRAQLRGKELPVIRGMGRGEWVDAVHHVDAGIPEAPVLEHDLGYWGGDYFEGGSVAQRIGDYLASMVTKPHATITELGLIYDPRRQIGDVYTLRSDWLGIELRVLVTRISEEHGDGSHQTVTVRIISATNTRGVTYGDLEAAWATSNYAGLEAAWDLLTYADFEADPLRGAPS